jgi:hypothetical protein
MFLEDISFSILFVSQGFNRSKLVGKPRSWAEPEDGSQCALEAAEESGAGELDGGKNRKSDSYLVKMESWAFFERCEREQVRVVAWEGRL